MSADLMRRGHAGLLLMLASVLTAAECPAQQHRQIDPARTHVVLSAPAAVGGPRTAAPTAGPRFPLVPAGALAMHPSPGIAAHAAGSHFTPVPAGAAAAHPAAAGQAAAGAVKAAGNTAAVAPRHLVGIVPPRHLSTKSSAATPVSPGGAQAAASPAAAAPAPSGAAAPAQGTPSGNAGGNPAPAATPSPTTAPQQ